MKTLQQILIELVDITEDDWKLLECILRKETYTAKVNVISAGNIAMNIYFIENGLMRSYYLSDGKEVNTYLATDGQFISTFSSFITQSPSFEFLEAMEPSTVYSIPYEGLTSLYAKSRKFEKLGRLLAEQNYLCVLNRTLAMQSKTAKERYLDFIKEYPQKIVQRVPQHQIASFLGMAPESLSRVRKKLVRS